MKNHFLYIETQGVKGGSTKSRQEGYVFVEIDEDLRQRIWIDKFGDKAQITITENGETIFEGNFNELSIKLKKTS